jgi:hypothetical protein
MSVIRYGRWGGRRDPPLGRGIWLHAYQRFDRAVRRYREAAEQVEYRQVRQEIQRWGAVLEATTPQIRSLCERAQLAAPSSGDSLPRDPDGRFHRVHRRISRAATLCALAYEHASLARTCARARDVEGLVTAVDALARTVKQLRELVEETADELSR